MSSTLNVNGEQFERLVSALNARAEQINENNKELQALFDIRQSFGSEKEHNKGSESIDVSFSKVTREEAKNALSKPNPELPKEHEDTLHWLASLL